MKKMDKMWIKMDKNGTKIEPKMDQNGQEMEQKGPKSVKNQTFLWPLKKHSKQKCILDKMASREKNFLHVLVEVNYGTLQS